MSQADNNINSANKALSEYNYDPDKARMSRVHTLLSQYSTKLHIQPLNNYLLSLHAKIRDSNTKQAEFVKYSDILLQLLCEYALEQLEFTSNVIKVPYINNSNEETADFDALQPIQSICCVSILRAGESMESAILSCLPEVAIGKILIQRMEGSNPKEPIHAKLFYTKLPNSINNSSVLLLDPMLATGSSAILAIEQLTERGVAQENIYLTNLISCPEGIRGVFNKFPNIHLITGCVDEKLNEKCYIIPGIGDFGDRYYGTN
jgi:uracil phosphoribosyltransferase